MREFLKIISAVLILSLTACGGGGSSSGGGEPARECISAETDILNRTTVVTNSCSFNVNVLDLSENPDTGVTLVPANSSVTIGDSILFFGACRAPSAPIRESSVEFRCT